MNDGLCVEEYQSKFPSSYHKSVASRQIPVYQGSEVSDDWVIESLHTSREGERLKPSSSHKHFVITTISSSSSSSSSSSWSSFDSSDSSSSESSESSECSDCSDCSDCSESPEVSFYSSTHQQLQNEVVFITNEGSIHTSVSHGEVNPITEVSSSRVPFKASPVDMTSGIGTVTYSR